MTACYDIFSIGGPYSMMPPYIESYIERESRFLPLRFIKEKSGYVILSTGSSNSFTSGEELIFIPSVLDVEDCVSICQRVLGLKIQEIAQLLDISRATLDLHRKGKVKDFVPYLELTDFVKKIEAKYTSEIYRIVKSVLIDRKTLVQHMLAHKKNLEKTLPYFDKAYERLDDIHLNKTVVSPDAAASRLAGIGKMG